MSETEEVFPGIDPNRKPDIVFNEGKLYCDGILVEPWQLTDDEKAKYIPHEFLNQYVPAGVLTCPFEGCVATVTVKNSWLQHTRIKHKDFCKVWEGDMGQCNTYEEWTAYVKERQNA